MVGAMGAEARGGPIEIGLTGGIAAGKSTVSARLRELGATVIDADAQAREVVAPGSEGLEAVLAAFGDAVRAADGSLDRAALGAIVFRDLEARARLEAITHPRIAALRRRRTEEAGTAGVRVVVHDIPLLVEGDMGDQFDLVLVVHAPDEERVARMVRERGMSEEDARARIDAQATDAQRRAVADVWLDNTGAPADLVRQVDAAWEGPIARLVAARAATAGGASGRTAGTHVRHETQ